MPAVMWKREPVEAEQEKLPLSATMHRKAGSLGYSGIPKLSSIDKRWFMEVNETITEDGRYVSTRFNVALGTGDTPLEAAAEGYAQVADEMRFYPILARVEAVVPHLRRRADVLVKLDKTLDGLTSILRSINVPRPAAPDEDDDL